MEQRFTFDKVADLYDAARPNYPSALFDDLVAVANLEPFSITSATGYWTRRSTQQQDATEQFQNAFQLPGYSIADGGLAAELDALTGGLDARDHAAVAAAG